MQVTPLDLEHMGLPGAICAWLLATPDGPALVDPGPTTTLERLREGLEGVDVALSDVRHVFLTHVHLDHAGVTGHLASDNPRLVVHVHDEGAPHMAEPERLVASTRRTFGDAHDRLFGEVRPVPASRIRGWRPGERGPIRGLRALPTPGHIGHHLAYLDESDGTLFAGDALGIILAPDAPSHPPTPPPTVDVEAWRRTLEEIAAVGPERAAVTHFGMHGDVVARTESLDAALVTLEARVRESLEDPEAEATYEAEVRETLSRHLPRERVDRYFDTFSATKDWAGMRRYVEKRKERGG